MSEDNKLSEESKLANDQIVEYYAKTMHIPMEEARDRLEKKFKKELENKDLGQQYLLLIKAFREMSPKLNGVVMRETDMANSVKALSNKVSGLEYNIHTLNERLDFERDLFKKAISLLNERNQPLHLRIWNKIKCLLKR